MRSLLLVDDSATTLAVEKSFLESKRFKVFALTDASRVLDMARALHPDLVVLDYELPGQTGDALCRRLKAESETAAIPVMILSAHEEAEVEARCLQAGAVRYARKSLGREALLDVVCEILALPRRAHVRVPCHLRVGVLSGGHEVRGVAHNLSEAGVYVTVEGQIPDGALVNLVLALPGRQGEARILAEVVRSEDLGGALRGYGMQFIEADASVLESLRAFVSQLV